MDIRTSPQTVKTTMNGSNALDDQFPQSSAVSFRRLIRARSFGTVEQAETSDCGIACVAMIAAYYDHNISLTTLRSRFDVGGRGVDAKGILEIASSIGLVARALQLDLDEIRFLRLPCILHWNLDHFVVLERVTKRGFKIRDPSIGARTIIKSDFSKSFTGIAIELNTGPNFTRRKPPAPINLRSLAGSIRGLRTSGLYVFLASLVIEVLALSTPLFFQFVADQVVPDHDVNLLTILGVTFILISIFSAIASTVRSYLLNWLGSNLGFGWTTNSYRKMLSLTYSFFQARTPGDILVKFSSIEQMQKTLTTKALAALFDGVASIITVIILLIYSTKLLLVSILFVVTYAGLRVGFYTAFREANLKLILARTKQENLFVESLRAISTIKTNNQEASQASRYANATALVTNGNYIVENMQSGFSGFQALILGLQRTAVLWIGTEMCLQGYVSVGLLAAFASYTNQLSTRIGNLVDFRVDLFMFRMQSERLADIVLAPSERSSNLGELNLSEDSSLRFKNASFRYSARDPWILRNTTLRVASGECVAIVGPSGCGKSTVAGLIIGLLDLTDGNIVIGGTDITRIGKKALRSRIGSVLQTDTLLDGSVYENITFFEPGFQREAVEKAAKLACIYDEICCFPMGFNTPIVNGGAGLSSGQQQRILIARALYRSPDILIMDEATSNLDVDLERSISECIEHLKMTRIIIAHRPETIARCDRVIGIENAGFKNLIKRARS